MPLNPISTLPPELLRDIIAFAVESLPPSLRIRSAFLRSFALVATSWRDPAQSLLESSVQIDSYQRAVAYLDRPRSQDRPLAVQELVLFWDFAPQDDDFYPLTPFITRRLCESLSQVRSLHLRSALIDNSFDANLLLLPAFRGLEHLKLDLPLDPPDSPPPFHLAKLSLSSMMDQPLALFRTLLPASSANLTSLHLLVITSGAPLHDRLVDALPSLSSCLRFLPVSTHWIPLPESLLRFISSCTDLESMVFANVNLSQIRRIIATSSSHPASFEFTIPSSPIFDAEFPTLFDELLNSPTMRRIRRMKALRRVQNEEARTSWERGGERKCSCVYELTSRVFKLSNSSGPASASSCGRNSTAY
ncbi:hypothetical protein JCM11641_004377 [Rhodosporidiobolus odoratus]